MTDLNSRKTCKPVALPANRPLLMGVLNITPDSFSDGGDFLNGEKAVEAGLAMVAEGADLIDVGGESTRPGADVVSADEELTRVLPVVEGLVRAGVTVSIDTNKPTVAEAALQAGVALVNDVFALRTPGMAELCAQYGCTVCLMHMQGEPRTMQAAPYYEDVVHEVRSFLTARARSVEEVGLAKENIWIDPGIGFGKSAGHNLTLIRHLDALVATGYPVLLGVSRKSFLGRLTGAIDPKDRLEATLAANVLGQANGARILRAHDVRAAKRAITITSAILHAEE